MASTEVVEQQNDHEVEKVSCENLESLWKSDEGVAAALSSFQACHDLCARSKLFGDDVVLKVDQCAVDFRQLSLETASVAKTISNNWLDTAIMVLGSLGDMDKSEKVEIFKLLGDQAIELSYCYKIFALWAKDISGRFHRAQDGTIRESEELKRAFEDTIEEGEATLKVLKKDQETVLNFCKECEASEHSWASKLNEAHASGPYTLVWTRLLSSAEHRSLDAKKSEEIIVKERKKIQKELEDRKKQYAKAKSTTETTVATLELLAHLESTYEATAAYWITEAESLKSQCNESEEKSEAVDLASLKQTIWSKAKNEIDAYVMRLSKVSNMFNFETKAKTPEARTIECEKLGLTFGVPMTVNLQENDIPIKPVETKVRLSV